MDKFVDTRYDWDPSGGYRIWEQGEVEYYGGSDCSRQVSCDLILSHC